MQGVCRRENSPGKSNELPTEYLLYAGHYKNPVVKSQNTKSPQARSLQFSGGFGWGGMNNDKSRSFRPSFMGYHWHKGQGVTGSAEGTKKVSGR